MRGPIPTRCPRGCGNPSPTRCPRGCVDPSPSLSLRMRGPIPTRCPRGCGNSSPTRCLRGCGDPSPRVVLADAGTHPLDVDSDATGVRYSRVEPAPVKTDAGIHPPTRQSRAPLTPLPLLSSWQAHDGDGASSADRSPCPPGCWTTDRRRTPGPPRAARPPSARARRRGCSGRP